MTRDEVSEKVKKIVCEQLGNTNIATNEDLRREWGADSLDMMDLVYKFEKAFGIIISDQDIDDYFSQYSGTTVASIAKMIYAKQTAQKNVQPQQTKTVATEPIRLVNIDNRNLQFRQGNTVLNPNNQNLADIIKKVNIELAKGHQRS